MATNPEAVKKQVKPPPEVVVSADGLLGHCQAKSEHPDPKQPKCIRQGALRVISDRLTQGRVILCDVHAAGFKRQGFEVHTVRAGEFPEMTS